MSETKMLLGRAIEQHLQIKQIVMELLSTPMDEEQKEMILKLYRLVK